MKISTIQFDSAEQMLLTAVNALQTADYAPIEMRDGGTPVDPAFLSVATIPTGTNAGKLFARVSANIELNSSLAFSGPVALAVKEFDSTDAAPSEVYNGLTLGSGGSSSETVYDVSDYDLAFAFLPESINESETATNPLSGILDISGLNRHAVVPAYSVVRCRAAGHNAFCAMPNFNDDSISLTLPTSQAQDFTMYFTLMIGAQFSYATLITGSDYSVSLEQNTITVQGASATHNFTNVNHDNEMAIYMIDFSTSHIYLFRNGDFIEEIAHSGDITMNNWTQIFNGLLDDICIADFGLSQGRLSRTEMDSLNKKIAAFRGISVGTIS